MRLAPLSITVLALLAGCGDDEEAPTIEVSTVERPTPRRPGGGVGLASGPAAIEENVRRGEEIFRKDCAGCHGVDGRGLGYNVRQFEKEPLGNLAAGASVANRGAEAVLAAIRDGAGVPGDPPWARMPAYGATYGEAQEAALLAYLEVLPGRSFPPEVNLSSTNEARCQPCHASSARALLAETNCAGCHDLPGFSRRAVGPDLSEVGSRFRKAWIYAFLIRPFNRHPLGYRALETNRMPDFGLSEEERRALAEFLSRQRRREPFPPPPDLSDPSLARAGEKIFRIADCAACHEIANYGGRIGPELSGAGLQFEPDGLWAWLSDPRSVRSDTSMPKPALPEEDLRSVAAYLLECRSKFPGVVNLVRIDLSGTGKERPAAVEELQGVDRFPEAGTREEADELAARGERLFEELGCRGCHELGGTDRPPAASVGPSLATAGLLYERDWFYDFLLAPRRIRPELTGRMPRFYFTASEAADIAHALAEIGATGYPEVAARLASASAEPSSRERDPEEGRRIFVEADCHSCHVRGEEEFPPVKAPYFTGEEQEERKRWAPDLAHASRLSPVALLLQLEDPARARPDARMPRITLSAEERDALADYLAPQD